MRMILLSPMLALMFGVGISCEPAEFPLEGEIGAEAADSLVVAAGGTSLTATISDTGIIGPEINLGRYRTVRGGALRGEAFGRAVNVSVENTLVEGLAGTQPVNLDVTRRGGVLQVRGMMGGEIADFAVGDGELAGSVGPCGYDLTAVSGRYDRYEGWRSCGGPPEPVSVRIPPDLGRWSAAEIGAVLAIVLGAGVI